LSAKNLQIGFGNRNKKTEYERSDHNHRNFIFCGDELPHHIADWRNTDVYSK